MGTRDTLEFKLTIQRLTRLGRERKVRNKSKVSSTVSESVHGAGVGKTPGAEGAHAEKEDCLWPIGTDRRHLVWKLFRPVSTLVSCTVF